MKLIPLLFLAPAAALACGGYFYEAPPTLDHYPERLPRKTMRELMREANPPKEKPATFDQLAKETRELVAVVAKVPHDEMLAKIDAALERNRQGDYRKRFANLLNDLHDLVLDGAAEEAEKSGYLEERLAYLSQDDGFIRGAKALEGDQRTPEERLKAQLAEADPAIARTEAGAEKASPALRPHWEVLRGALRFRKGQFAAARDIFQKTVDDFPEHPRAEVALLMVARCDVEEWREAAHADPPEERAAELLDVADQALSKYVEQYPEGRFANDVPGWRVDLAREKGDTAEAVKLLLGQMDQQAHPEIVRRAARELDLMLDETDLSAAAAETDENESEKTFPVPVEELAKRPLAALAVVYHYLDARSRRDFDKLMYHNETLTEKEITSRDLEPVLRLREAGQRLLPALAKEMAKHRDELGARWRPKYLAVLAWAASETGDHLQAAQLCRVAGPALAESDDLSFALAVALQRGGELRAARTAFETLRQSFPKSPLRTAFDFRLATVLRDLGEAGLATVELMNLNAANESSAEVMRNEEEQIDAVVQNATAEEAVDALERAQAREGAEDRGKSGRLPPLHLPEELAQWIDTMLQFAPLDQLERGWKLMNERPEEERRFRDALRWRHLAAEHFAEARKFAVPEGDTATQVADDEKATGRPPLVGQEWTTTVARLERATNRLKTPSAPAAQARAELELAVLWSRARGRLTLPSLPQLYDEAAEQRNARVAGYSKAVSAHELEMRDELHHALPHLLTAAELAPGTSTAAEALRRANEALRLLAERSAWSAARAFETDAAGLSRRCYDTLRTEFRGDAAVKNDVWWSFRPPAEEPWSRDAGLQNENRELPAEMEVAVLEGFRPKAADDEHPSSAFDEFEPWRKRLDHFTTQSAKWTNEATREELQRMRKEFRAEMSSAWGSSILNDLDDLLLFLAQPKVTEEARRAYFRLRLSRNEIHGTPEELNPWEDFVAFLRLVREPGTPGATGEPDQPRPMHERMREFLNAFPKSVKAEAALTRLAISAARAAHGHAGVTDLAGTQQPQLFGGLTIDVKSPQPDLLPLAQEALAEYARSFPKGRYVSDLRLWRGALAIDVKNWVMACQDLTATLDDAAQSDLHLDAALNLGMLFLQILDQPEQRSAIVEAIRQTPSAQARLWQFLKSETPGWRLRVLEDYLRESLEAR